MSYRSGPSLAPADFYLHEFPWQAIWNTVYSHIRLKVKAKTDIFFFFASYYIDHHLHFFFQLNVYSIVNSVAIA